jgi:hypothetical protein
MSYLMMRKRSIDLMSCIIAFGRSWERILWQRSSSNRILSVRHPQRGANHSRFRNRIRFMGNRSGRRISQRRCGRCGYITNTTEPRTCQLHLFSGRYSRRIILCDRHRRLRAFTVYLRQSLICSAMMASIPEHLWPNYATEVLRILKPGTGWAVFIEVSARLKSDTSPIENTAYHKVYPSICLIVVGRLMPFNF